MAWMRSDDLDGTPANLETFGLFGKAYAVSLGDVNRAKLEAALRPFLTVATVYGTLPVPPEEKVVLVREPATAEEDPAPVVAPQPRARRQRRAKAAVTPVAEAATPHRTIRAWANDNGYAVGAQGRIPNAVLEAYSTRQG